MIKKILITAALLFAIVCFVPGIAHAQINPGCNPDEACPIDSGVLFLFIAALALAAIKAVRAGKHTLVKQP